MDRRLRLLRRLPRSPISDAVSQSYHNFLSGAKVDADGSVYRETIVRMPSASTAPKPKPWETTLAGRRTSLGAPSLLLCVRKMLTELLCDLSVEALQALPWRLGRMIWEDAEATWVSRRQSSRLDMTGKPHMLTGITAAVGASRYGRCSEKLIRFVR